MHLLLHNKEVIRTKEPHGTAHELGMMVLLSLQEQLIVYASIHNHVVKSKLVQASLTGLDEGAAPDFSMIKIRYFNFIREVL